MFGGVRSRSLSFHSDTYRMLVLAFIVVVVYMVLLSLSLSFHSALSFHSPFEDLLAFIVLLNIFLEKYNLDLHHFRNSGIVAKNVKKNNNKIAVFNGFLLKNKNVKKTSKKGHDKRSRRNLALI